MRILIAKDEKDIRTLYYITLVYGRHEVILTSDGQECLTLYRLELQDQQQEYQHEVSSSYFDVLILDHRMPKKNRLRVAKGFLG
jgi:CheY-like chemotaxis protein